jgi:hypothetical protein
MHGVRGQVDRADIADRLGAVTTHLRLNGHRVGLLMNFNAPLLKDGILRRVV